MQKAFFICGSSSICTSLESLQQIQLAPLFFTHALNFHLNHYPSSPLRIYTLLSFQTLLQRFLVGFSDRLFIVGGVVVFPLMACQKMYMIMFPRNYCGIQNLIYAQKFSKQTRKLDRPSYRKSSGSSRRILKISFALNTDGFTGNNDQGNNPNEDSNSGLGGTRLGRIVSAGGRELLSKLNSARKNFPTKVFLLLLGFYTANALATILGQTGDWDVLVAGIVVAAIEGIGMLMYKRPLRTGRLQSLVGMVNYWKAGVCLGLFVDAFKLGS